MWCWYKCSIAYGCNVLSLTACDVLHVVRPWGPNSVKLIYISTAIPRVVEGRTITMAGKFKIHALIYAHYKLQYICCLDRDESSANQLGDNFFH